MVNILNDIEYLFFPEICLGCHRLLPTKGLGICVYCRHELPFTRFEDVQNNAMEKIFFGRVPIEKAYALLWFEKHGIVQSLLHHLKYKRQQQVGMLLGQLAGDVLLESSFFEGIDVVMPVPLHPKKLKQRGYNQVALFAKTVSEKLKASYEDGVLTKQHQTQSQTFKDRLHRWLGSQTIYKVELTPEFYGKHILLVDDIVTTGATLEKCVKALKTLPGVRVSLLTMAITA